MKKTIALLLACFMAFALVACQQQPSGGQTPTQAPSAPAGDPAPGGDTPAAGDDDLKGPGNIKLKRLGVNVGFDVNADYMVPVIQEATGYEVEYFSLPAENADEKLLMEVAGGADYDVVNVSVNQWRTLMAQGALIPLNSLLETYGQDIYKGNSDTTWAALSDADGNIYGVPYMYPHSQEVASFMACRWDLMQEAGVTAIPTTIDEFYDCLVKLKAHFGNKYIIFSGPYKPASEGNENWVIPKTIASAFGIYNDWMTDASGKVYYMTEAPGFAAMIEFLSKLNKEGLLDTDWAVNTDSTVNEKFASGKAIIACSNRAGVQVTTPAQMETLGLTYDDVGYIGALKGSDGTCTYMRTEAINQVSCILKSSKNPADAMNWMNTKVKEQLFICIGVEGTHFTYDSEGAISPINPSSRMSAATPTGISTARISPRTNSSGRPVSVNPRRSGRHSMPSPSRPTAIPPKSSWTTASPSCPPPKHTPSTTRPCSRACRITSSRYSPARAPLKTWPRSSPTGPTMAARMCARSCRATAMACNTPPAKCFSSKA